MGKLRLTFVKEGRAVYLSHLDLLRTFQRVFLRQGLVLRHSPAYHPHPIISFALPLPVGQASDCEVLDFEVTEDLTGAGLAEDLNRFMPDGIRALDCRPPVRPVRDLAELRCRVELPYDGGVPAGGAGGAEAPSPRGGAGVAPPYAHPVDSQTGGEETPPADNAVTIRDRDTMEQVRVPIDQLKAWLTDKLAY